MRGLAQLQRRLEALERAFVDDEGRRSALMAMTDDELRAYMAQIAEAPWAALQTATARGLKRITEASDLELQAYLRACEEARRQGHPLPRLGVLNGEGG